MSDAPVPLWRRLRRAVAKLDIYALWRRLEALEPLTAQSQQLALQLSAAEHRLDEIEAAIRLLQHELAETLSRRVAAVEHRMDGAEDRIDGANRRHDGVEEALRLVQDEAARLRDGLIPALSGRTDALLGRMMAEHDELASLVERSLRGEALPTLLGDGPLEETLAQALAAVQPALVAAFRGAEEEITHRLDPYLGELRAAAPVLDLGCGRGELLLLLREAGVEARGVEADPALVEAARRRGLEVVAGDVHEVLRALPEESVGAVTAFHLFEHLPPARLAATLAEVRRVLRPGGLLLVEGPNAGSLMVAGSLHWLDPTHQHPLHAETLRLFVVAAGLEPQGVEYLHPFEPEQLLTSSLAETDPPPADGPRDPRLERLAARLDELIHGQRDFVLRATRPVD